MQKESVVAIQVSDYFDKLAAVVHRNGRSRIYKNLTGQSLARLIFLSSTKSREQVVTDVGITSYYI